MGSYRRIGVLSIGNAMLLVDSKDRDIDVEGYRINTRSLRYRVFKRDNMCCSGCGLRGAFFALEQSPHQTDGRAHLNLYGLDSNGNEVLFTKDHVFPRSRGGKDNLDNLQAMCSECNQKKSDSVGDG